MKTVEQLRREAYVALGRSVEDALVASDWSIKYAAQLLEVPISSLQDTLKAYPALERQRLDYLASMTQAERRQSLRAKLARRRSAVAA